MTRQLLPAALENRRRDIPVVDSLPAKGFPGYVNGLRRMGTVHDVYGWTNVHAHINMSADEAYALTDKRSPHALYELMLMSAGVTPRPGLHDHSPEFGKALGVIAARFAEHCRAYELSPVVSWSYARTPWTASPSRARSGSTPTWWDARRWSARPLRREQCGRGGSPPSGPAGSSRRRPFWVR
ncbi:hypothetical protein ACWD4K_17395 [Streptomyces gelaticus]